MNQSIRLRWKWIFFHLPQIPLLSRFDHRSRNSAGIRESFVVFHVGDHTTRFLSQSGLTKKSKASLSRQYYYLHVLILFLNCVRKYLCETWLQQTAWDCQNIFVINGVWITLGSNKLKHIEPSHCLFVVTQLEYLIVKQLTDSILPIEVRRCWGRNWVFVSWVASHSRTKPLGRCSTTPCRWRSVGISF